MTTNGKHERVLITGGAGFIGGHLAHALVDEEFEVTCLDNLSMGKRENVPVGAQFVEGDVRDRSLTERLAAEADVVFHLAAVVAVRASVDRFYEDAENNIMGTLSMLDACKGSPVRKFLFASSMAVYGESTGLMAEDYPVHPISPYGIAKLAGEEYVRNICQTLGIDSVLLRYFNAYGTKQTFTPYVGVITIFIKRLLAGKPITIFGTGEQIRDYVSVKDLVQASVLAVTKNTAGETINVASGVVRTVNEIAQMLIDELAPGTAPRYGAPQPGEIFRSEPDITKARFLLGYQPEGDLGQELRGIIDWYRSDQ